MTAFTVSAVVATRNRPDSLRRLLQALARQTRLPDEVIVVDASDNPENPAHLAAAYPLLRIRYFPSRPNLPAQRNLGIQQARGSHVFISDDDIEPPAHYLATLIAYLEHHPACGCVTGFIQDPEGAGIYRGEFPVPTVREVLLAFLFQRSLGGRVDAVAESGVLAPVLAFAKRWFRRRGNSWSLAGWPLITQVDGSVVRTGVYYLGASVVRKDWLLASPYDENLGPHGIGDNYGVATGLPKERAIEILVTLPVTHHRDPRNRLSPEDAYYRRVMALNYFLATKRLRPKASRAFLLWSLAGAVISFSVRRNHRFLKAALRAARDVVRSAVTGRPSFELADLK